METEETVAPVEWVNKAAAPNLGCSIAAPVRDMGDEAGLEAMAAVAGAAEMAVMAA
ncbi:hypothetical protein [Bradyrhizobium sacchari]|uniref:hypothetical protein n=1 Tax=Bradyrhizobium sacchari TaxID=1399419 RepID=UPI0013747BC7|nr:hypothetical protein [Bradyrhizobium sacchari]